MLSPASELSKYRKHELGCIINKVNEQSALSSSSAFKQGEMVKEPQLSS
jgi:hypothetical protein